MTPISVSIDAAPLGNLGSWLPHIFTKMLKKSAEIPKQYAEIRRNTLSIRRNTQAKTPQANKPYGTEEVFEVFKVFASYPVGLGNRPYRPGDYNGYFL